ncbi:hypothetical protein [Streptomyces alanosinicus]|nr:hypothetical protein [Streptomyces alanosinicus]
MEDPEQQDNDEDEERDDDSAATTSGVRPILPPPLRSYDPLGTSCPTCVS